MAIDHYLASNYHEFNLPILRFYGWKRDTISLGFHQKKEQVLENKIITSNIDLVRRPTGGRAIFHSNELTYSIIYPVSELSKFVLYKKINTAFKKAFDKFTLASLENEDADLASFYKKKDSFSCFAVSARGEMKSNDKKLIGSAQRIYKDAILQHGSIMLGAEHLKLVDYLNIEPYHRQSFKERLESRTSYLELKEIGLSLEELILEIRKNFETILAFKSFQELSLDGHNIKYDL